MPLYCLRYLKHICIIDFNQNGNGSVMDLFPFKTNIRLQPTVNDFDEMKRGFELERLPWEKNVVYLPLSPSGIGYHTCGEVTWHSPLFIPVFVN